MARVCPAPSPAPIAASPQPSGGLGCAVKAAPRWMFLLEKCNSPLTGEAGLHLWRGGESKEAGEEGEVSRGKFRQDCGMRT